MSSGNLLETLNREILNALKSSETVEGIANAIEKSVHVEHAKTGKKGADLADALSDVLLCTIQTAAKAKGDLGKAIKGFTLGFFRSGKLNQQEGVQAVIQMPSFFLRYISECGGPLDKAVQSFLEATINAARSRFWDVAEIAYAASSAVVRAAYRISTDAGDSVQLAVLRTIAHEQVILKEPDVHWAPYQSEREYRKAG